MGNTISTRHKGKVRIQVAGKDFTKATVEAFLESAKEDFDQKLASPTKDNAKLDEFEMCAGLGKGSFGTVILVKKKNNNTFYAMKIIRKKYVAKCKQVRYLLNEKAILQAVNFSFLLKLEFCFKSNSFLFMVMKYASGGQLLHHLHKKTSSLNELEARFCAGQVVLAFEYLHYLHVVFRDLKPENIVLDERGYIRLTDFGFAKVLKDRTWTICGTPGYMAPEILLRKGHKESADWWTLGIFIYDIITGYLPFQNSNEVIEFNMIIACEFQIPEGISENLNDLLRKLITRDVDKRLGGLKNGVSGIKNHPWFEETDWVKLYLKEVDSPFKLNVQRCDSTENFDKLKKKYSEDSAVDLFPLEFEDF